VAGANDLNALLFSRESQIYWYNNNNNNGNNKNKNKNNYYNNHSGKT
jgi:hypothetical protein